MLYYINDIKSFDLHILICKIFSIILYLDPTLRHTLSSGLPEVKERDSNGHFSSLRTMHSPSSQPSRYV